MTFAAMSGATFSEDRLYRRLLWRVWDDTMPLLNMLMLNPSKAGEAPTESDPTVTRQIQRARLLGCGGLLVTNAFDLVSTDPKVLRSHPRPLSAENDGAIVVAARRAHESGGKCVAGWGKHCTETRQATLVRMFEAISIPLHAIGINEDGSPQHPLYVKYDAPLVPWP